ncbi:LacI family DNA-binding transcriptional regulator [[Clostridium] colinum]|uniref:LacI family DNA-binding transcriptional regulator n=1 Tax=[Clostridium] colinum TaxID=36835 RepID=UPI0020244FF6|nr:LacI family DNA-binding transcriptional regulator [[Clostridium] colinum]
MSKVTIQDIANMCQVSKSSVSRYLNGGYVSKENKEKIKEAIEKTGFKSNFFAKRLKSKNSNLIGAVIPRIDSITVGKVLNGINNTCVENNYTILMQSSNLDLKKEIDCITSLYNQGVDGIIVYTLGITNDHIKIYNNIKIPIIFLNQKNENVNYICIDDYKAGYIMAEYFYKNNHKNIVFLGVNEKDKSVGIERKKGFYDFYKKNVSNYTINFVETDFSFKKAYNKGNDVLKFNPTGVICATDNICLGFMLYLNEQGIKIPDEISVAGFGGYEVSSVIKPSITTIEFNYELLGKIATKNILNLISNNSNDEKVDIDLKLILGESIKNIGDNYE